MDNQISQKNIQKLLKESLKAAQVAVKNSHTIETLLSIKEIKSGNFKKFSTAEKMFESFGI